MQRNFRSFTLRSTSVALGAVIGVFTLGNQPAFAQQASTTPQPAEQMEVVAPEVVQQKNVGRTSIGAPIDLISLSRRVSYADLDLTRQSDVNEFRKRIEDTAKAACKELDNRYPDGSLYQPIPSEQNCVKTATSNAMDEADLVIATANHIAAR